MRMLVLVLLSLLFIIPTSLGQEVSLDIEGECREFNVTVFLNDFGAGCYDIKIDVTTPAGRVGRIFDPREGWKSSIYYVNEGFCIEEGQNESKIFQVFADTSYNELSFKGSVRHGSLTWNTGYYDITGNCPEAEPHSDIVVIFIIIISIEIMLLGYVIFDILRRRGE